MYFSSESLVDNCVKSFEREKWEAEAWLRVCCPDRCSLLCDHG